MRQFHSLAQCSGGASQVSAASASTFSGQAQDNKVHYKEVMDCSYISCS